eukprot:CAMPEP_0201739506 /NCGR_PEP_ID=MMETSP0593-20130828/45813_1 /ASSEMBLY_ACC=CAM_ASM_000672 /TAXON_ID=267983 /ORGANISM="Skeletonema japonicum, Strain CCMP2506" /LENGTH=565 /DNA_ID=CAMNT_0048233779 /DNA_START=104 /DNA_END=1801 /DNA_ORIENTATION=-
MSLAVLAAICLPVGLFHLKRLSTDDNAPKRDHRHLSLLPYQNDDQRIPRDKVILKKIKAFYDAGPLSAPVPPTQISPYTLNDVISVLPTFHDVFGVVIYDPSTDKFILHYSNNMRWIAGCHKLVTSFQALAHSLRTMFPERFTPDAASGNKPAELALAISSGDYPGVGHNDCYVGLEPTPCVPADLAPVLQFGSAFKSPEIYPSMIAMPMAQINHVSCFQTFAAHQMVCPYYLARSPGNPQGLVFEETVGLGWDELIPSVVWRGTDFSYLHRLYPRLRQPDFEMDIGSKLEKIPYEYNIKVAATRAMRVAYDELIPRWKSVIWTAEAEREAEEKQKELPEDSEEVVVPWANMKFAAAMHVGVKTPTSEIPYYQEFVEHGIPASGEGMSLETLARYKYHIDTGGGGGTTWSGTLEKLGLPGLLFHHETPMKDYLHEKIVKWVHYVPIKEDLSDLKEKFDWAESHPELAKQISDNATRLAKRLGTHEGFSIMFNEFYETPLRAVVEAYKPLTKRDPVWLDAMINNELRPIMQCSGYYSHDCEGLVDDVTFSQAARHGRDFERSGRRQ